MLMFQQLWGNKHHRLRDSKFGRVEVMTEWKFGSGRTEGAKINKQRINHDVGSALGRAVKKKNRQCKF